MKTGRYSIKDLFHSSEISQIIIPEMQRDYVWNEINVNRLVNSIYTNFKNRKSSELDIRLKENHAEIEEDMVKYLSLEYNKLHFNTRIGFIYAYHNRDYVDKFFLIDGQQRLTTIFLMILSASVLTGKAEDFKKNYFTENTYPKIDYQVREVSHDFLMSFLNHELRQDSVSSQQEDFKQSNHFYDLYQDDLTAQTIYRNYNVIKAFLKNKPQEEINDFLEYVENYIEFNYFDTNLSDQGERLYIYMNSRGESLSDHELVKTILIERSQNKLEAGTDWENWQNYLWQYRGANENSDIGFLEFLKCSVILHMSEFPSSIKKEDEKTEDKPRSEDERKEDYIRKNISNQHYWIRQYIVDNFNFDMDWLRKVMVAGQRLQSLINEPESIYLAKCVQSNWLSTIPNAIDYVTILGCIYYMMLYPSVSNANVMRLCLYLQNICIYTSNYKNPDRTVLRILKLIKWMKGMQIVDIRNLHAFNPEDNGFKDRNVYRNDDLRFEIYEQSTNEAAEWEHIFWQITLNAELNKFLQGNPNILIRLMKKGDSSPQLLRTIIKTFKKKIFDSKNSDILRKKLLEYGDISVSQGHGSSNLGRWMQRFDLLYDDDSWYSFFETDTAVNILDAYLKDLPSTNKNDICSYWALGLNYMSQKKFLWLENPGIKSRCVLLNAHQASEDKVREFPIACLHYDIKNSWIWDRNFCVVTIDKNGQDVEVIDAQQHTEERNKHYYLDFWYDYNEKGGRWYCQFGHKKHSLSDEIITEIQEKKIGGLEWEFYQDADTKNVLVKVKGPLYQEDVDDDLLKGKNITLNYFYQIMKDIQTLEKL